MKTRCLAALKLCETSSRWSLNGVCASRPVIPSSSHYLSPLTRKSYHLSPMTRNSYYVSPMTTGHRRYIVWVSSHWPESHTIFLLWPESYTIFLLWPESHNMYHLIWFQTQLFGFNWISLASFAHMFLRSDESLQSFPAQNNPTRKISEFSIFEFFSRPSVALSTGIEFPLGTTSFYLAAWCRCALKWTLMGFTLQNISHGIVMYMWTYCELQSVFQDTTLLQGVFCVGGWGTT